MTITSRYSQDEWLAMFDQTEQNLSNSPIHYKAPNVETEAFAKTIDHTLLKLEATGEQVDILCEEARRHNFKVCNALQSEI